MAHKPTDAELKIAREERIEKLRKRLHELDQALDLLEGLKPHVELDTLSLDQAKRERVGIACELAIVLLRTPSEQQVHATKRTATEVLQDVAEKNGVSVEDIAVSVSEPPIDPATRRGIFLDDLVALLRRGECPSLTGERFTTDEATCIISGALYDLGYGQASYERVESLLREHIWPRVAIVGAEVKA